jgi:peptidoglycan/LPS O-acetylase OafA/YrhL
MTALPPTHERLPALDGLRGAMAMCVAFYHYAMWFGFQGLGTPGNTLLAALGLYSVQGFFVLSGVCFYHLYRDARFGVRVLLAFHLKRYFRIAPLYYVSVLLCLALGLAVGPAPSARILLENFSLTFGFFHPNHALVVGGWSIGLECIFYVALPLMVLAGRLRYGLWFLLAGLLLVAVRADAHMLATEYAQRFHAYVVVGNHAFLFVIGALLAELRRLWSLRLPAWLLPLSAFSVGAGVFVACAPVSDHFALVSGEARIVGVALCASLVALAALTSARSSALTRAYGQLGELSFGVYMLHRVAYACVAPSVSGWPPAWRCVAALCVATLLAKLSLHVVERPFLRLGQRLAERVRDPGLSVAPSGVATGAKAR